MGLSSMPSSVLAFSTPSQDDWLKDLSLRRPTSVTRPTLSLPPEVGGSVGAAATGVSVGGAGAGVSVGTGAGVGVASAPQAASIGATSNTKAITSPARPNSLLLIGM